MPARLTLANYAKISAYFPVTEARSGSRRGASALLAIASESNQRLGFLLAGVALGPQGLAQLVPAAPWLAFFTVSEPAQISPSAPHLPTG